MPDYKYQGTSRSGGSVSGVMTASNKTELAGLLKRPKITATKMTEKGKEFNIPQFGGGVSAKELAIFTRQFSVMIDAGLPLVQCLEILASQQENKFFQKILAGTRGQVEGGATLSAAMRSSPKAFDALYVNMVEAGETGGILDTILQRLSTYIEKNVKLQRAVKSALVYPVGVLTVAGGVIILLLWKVVPIFATLFAGLGVSLPLPTRIVMGLSNLIGSWVGFMFLLAIGGGGYCRPESVVRYARRKTGTGFDHIEASSAWHSDEENRGRAFHSYAGNLDLERRAHSGRAGHYCENRGQRGGRTGAD